MTNDDSCSCNNAINHPLGNGLCHLYTVKLAMVYYCSHYMLFFSMGDPKIDGLVENPKINWMISGVPSCQVHLDLNIMYALNDGYLVGKIRFSML